MDSRIAWSLVEMEAHVADAFRVGTLAERVRLSPARFSRLFRDEVGMSPAAYLRQLRMERARLLLQRTFLSCEQVMAQVGLRDIRRFEREFKRTHGVTPEEFRRERC